LFCQILIGVSKANEGLLIHLFLGVLAAYKDKEAKTEVEGTMQSARHHHVFNKTKHYRSDGCTKNVQIRHINGASTRRDFKLICKKGVCI
jgi:hypothetical protein